MSRKQKSSVEAESTQAGVKSDAGMCPICRCDKYITPNMKLLVSPCYHRICESCVDRIFSTGSANCPSCRMTLRKSQWVSPIFEDLYVEKECRVRKRINKIFNKRLQDFGDDLDTFNGYLEEVEDIVFNLVNELNVADMNARIEQFQSDNLKVIQKNSGLKQLELEALAAIIQEEKDDHKVKMDAELDELKRESVARSDRKQKLLGELALSRHSATQILARAEASHPPHSASSVQPTHLLDNTTIIASNERQALLQNYLNETSVIAAEATRELLAFDPTESSCPRVMKTIKDHYVDFALNVFDTEKYRAGGFSLQLAHQKAIEAAGSAIFTF